MLSADDERKYLKDGILILRSALSRAEREQLVSASDSVKTRACRFLFPYMRYWPGRLGRDETESHERRAQATWGVDELECRELFEPCLPGLFGHPIIAGAIHSLLGHNARAWRTSLLWAPTAEPYDLHWHRDQVPREHYDLVHLKPQAPDHVQINVALLSDSCLRVVPGSHRRPLSAAEWASEGKTTDDEQMGALVVELFPGDVALMDGHLLHRGTCDTRTQRLTLHLSAQASWVPLPPWRSREHLDRIRSDEFINQLPIEAQSFYRNLRHARQSVDPLAYLRGEPNRTA